MPLGDARTIADLALEVEELAGRAKLAGDRVIAREVLAKHADAIAEARRLVAADARIVRIAGGDPEVAQ